MNPLLIWLIGYALPALASGTAINFLPRNKGRLNIRNAVIINTALVLSILIIQYFINVRDLVFPWFPNLWSVIVYVALVLLIARFLGSMGFWYGISSLVQQAAILSVTFLLLPFYPLYIIVLLVVPMYAYCHLLSVRKKLLRVLLFLTWGTASVLLFSALQNIFLVASLHAFFGALLISKSLIYSEE